MSDCKRNRLNRDEVTGKAVVAVGHGPLIWMTGCILAIALLLVIVFWPRATSYVISAETEYLEIPAFAFHLDPQWRIDGFHLCPPYSSDAPDAGTEPSPDAPCGDAAAIALPDEPLLKLTEGTQVSVRRLSQGPLEIVLSRSAGEVGELGSMSGTDREQLTDLGTLVTLRAFDSLTHSMSFTGRAMIGQLAAAGNEGILLGGEAVAYQAGLGGAGRHQVDSTDLITGDVVTAEMSGDQNQMRGFFRFAGHDREGLRVVYLGNADRIRIDRLGSAYDFELTWTAKLLRDPLAAVLLALLTLAGTVAGTVAVFRPSGDA